MNYLIIILIFIVFFLLNNLCKSKKKETYKNYTPDELFNSLRYMSNVLSKYNIKHWVCHGTLLGAVRSNDIIPFDYDFDLGAYLSDINKLVSLNKIIEKDGYKLSRPGDNYGYLWNGGRKRIWRISLKIVFKGKIMGDIYLFQPFKDSITRRYDIKSETYFWPKMSFPTWFIRKLSKVRIRDKYFPCPRKPEALLKYWYGPKWKIPFKAPAQGGKSDKDYDYYGGYINTKMDQLLQYRDIEYRNLPLFPRKIKFYTPSWGKKWINDNEYKIN